MKRKYKITLITLTIIFGGLFLIGSISMGSFGIRPVTHGCLGLRIKSDTVERILPKGSFEIYKPVHFAYKVKPYPIEREHYLFDYCLGKDVWFGE